VTSARAITLLRHDVQLQWRYGIHLAYAVVVAIYTMILGGAGQALPRWVTGALLFSDPAALGFFFLGALMMLERSEGVRTALAVTPMSVGEYLFAKTATLTAVALVACAILAIAGPGGSDVGLLTLTVVLTSVQYVGIGVPIAIHFRTVNAYLVGSAGFLTPLVGPGFLALLDPLPTWLLVIPAVAQFRLLLVATGAATATPAALGVMLGAALLAAVGAMLLARDALARELGRR
jgi:fluoroquinolone transport system permease protein